MADKIKKRTGRVVPNQEELHSLSKATQHLWYLDENRFVPGVDYNLDVQGGKAIYSKEDMAREKLFKGVNRKKFFGKPTFKAFYDLLDNYESATGVAEKVTAQERKENWHFLDLICETPCMKYIHEYLSKKGKAPDGLPEFKEQLYSLWFELYGRQGRVQDSSGFEHVFVGEVKNGKVIGFHNWIQFFLEERKGNVDYKGYVVNRKARKQACTGREQMITIQFAWGEELKSVSSTFVGTSPEFEIALYTLCFYCGQEDNDVNVGPYHVNMKVHTWNTKHGLKMGASYPEAL